MTAAEYVRTKLLECDGKAFVTSLNGKTYEINLHEDGKSFVCDQLPINPPYGFKVFDVIVDLLIQEGGKAKKGNGHCSKLGEGRCTYNTIVGVIGNNYFGKSHGASVYDPVFVLAAILEWTGVAYNKRGYLELDETWCALLT